MSLLSEKLKNLLEESDYLALLNHAAGTRLYVPKYSKLTSLNGVLSPKGLNALIAEFGNSTIKIPLDRDFRIARYHSLGYSVAKIAKQLNMTEDGVGRNLQRLRMINGESACQ